MGRVLLGAGLTAIFLVTQGILILRTGSVRGIRAFFGAAPRRKLSPLNLLLVAGMHIVPGTAVLTLIVLVGLRSGLTVSGALQRLWAVNVNLLFAVVFLVSGVYFLIRPSTMLNWARTAEPDIPEDASAGFVIVRLIAAVFCFMGLFVLFALVS